MFPCIQDAALAGALKASALPLLDSQQPGGLPDEAFSKSMLLSILRNGQGILVAS